MPKYLCITVFLFIRILQQPVFGGDDNKQISAGETEYMLSDSLSLDTLIHYAKTLRYSEPGKAQSLLRDVHSSALEQGLINATVNSLYELSAVFFVNSQYDSATFFVDKAISFAEKYNNGKLKAKAYRLKGGIMKKMGMTNTAITYFYKSIQATGTTDSSYLAKIYNSLGLAFLSSGAYDSATYYLMKAYNIHKLLKMESSAYSALINLSEIMKKMGYYDKSRKFLSEAYQLINDEDEKINYYQTKALIFNKMGGVYYSENIYDSAMLYFRKSKSIYEQINDISGVISSTSDIGSAFIDIGEYDSALLYYKKALERTTRTGKVRGLIFNNIGNVFLSQNQFDKAITYFDSAVNIDMKYIDLEALAVDYLNLYTTYELQGNYKKAFEYLKKNKELSDSIYNLNKAKVVTDLEMKYEKEKDQAHILELRNENLEKNLELNRRTNQRNLILAMSAGLTVIGFLIFLFYRQKVQKDKIISAQKIEKLEREKKLLAARSIVEGQEEERKRIARELHDGLGVLLSTAKMHFKSIKTDNTENKIIIKKAALLLERASNDVRRISHNMMPGILTKLGLDEALNDLFEKFEGSGEFTVDLEIENEKNIRLSENIEIMIYRIVQEIVNNTLKYAQASRINLSLIYGDAILSLHYSDNGKGFDVEEKIKNKSIGLSSIKSRVDYLGGKLNIKSAPGKGADFFIDIPFSTASI